MQRSTRRAFRVSLLRQVHEVHTTPDSRPGVKLAGVISWPFDGVNSSESQQVAISTFENHCLTGELTFGKPLQGSCVVVSDRDAAREGGQAIVNKHRDRGPLYSWPSPIATSGGGCLSPQKDFPPKPPWKQPRGKWTCLDDRKNEHDDHERELSSPGSQPGDPEHEHGSRRGCFVIVSVIQGTVL